MGDKVDTVKRYIAEAWSNPPSSFVEAAMKTYSDDFQYIDREGNVVADKQGYIGMGQMSFNAFDDFHWVLKELREEDGAVIMTGHFEGIHTGDLDLTAAGAGVYPASGKKVVWPEATLKIEVSGGKFKSFAEHGGEGGIEAFIAALTNA